MNISVNKSNQSESLTGSLNHLEVSLQIKAISTLIVIVFGLVGHFLTVFVFSQKRFRINSCTVYILCLAANDACYLLIHFVEDILPNFIGTENLIICCLVNYLRYFLRFNSAYIHVLFTIQRFLIVSSPLRNRFKSNRTAWHTVLTITFISTLVNAWTIFMFEINSQHYCEVKKTFTNIYFNLTFELTS